MAFTDTLFLPGSFNGIQFFLDLSQHDTGKRAILHEFPDRNKPVPEDLGRKGKVFKLTMHLIGEDVFSQRDRLLKELNRNGRGELNHPYYGRLLVMVQDVSIREDNKVGRFISVEATFLEAGDLLFPTTGEDAIDFLDAVLAGAQNAINEIFSGAYSVLGFPQGVFDRAQQTVETALDLIEIATQPLQKVEAAVDEIFFDIQDIRANISTILQTPGDLADRLGTLVGRFSLGADDDRSLLSAEDAEIADDALDGLTGADFGSGDILTPTPNAEQEKENVEQIEKLIQRRAIIEKSRIAPNREFLSAQDAEQEQKLITGLIDSQIEEMNTSEEDELYQNFRDVRAAITETVPSEDAELPNLINVSFKTSLPTLVITHDLYESLELEQDVIDRNSIRNPGFVPGDTELEVIGRG